MRTYLSSAGRVMATEGGGPAEQQKAADPQQDATGKHIDIARLADKVYRLMSAEIRQSTARGQRRAGVE